MNTPYDLLKDTTKLQYYVQKLEIDDYKIFTSVLTSDNEVDKALSFVVSQVSGVANPAETLGWLNLQRIKNDSQDFLSEQIVRLENNLYRFNDELSINLLAFACMAFEMNQVVNARQQMSDVGHIFMGLFSRKKAEEWERSLYERLAEVVRWSYSSSILLIIHYIMLCEKHNKSYNLTELKSIAKYIGLLYASCNDTRECFVISYGHLISQKHQYIHDILLNHTNPISLYDLPEHHSRICRDIFTNYVSGDKRELILNDIEEYTIK